LWRWKYSFGGKEKRLSLGTWPEVTLREAREKCDAFRRELKSGEDPSPNAKKEKRNSEPTFREVAEAWRSNMTNVWAESHAITVIGRLNLDVYPAFGDRAIASLQPLDVLGMLRKIEARKAFDTARRVLGICSLIFRYGVATGVVASDPCRDLRGALVPYNSRHLAALTTPKDVGFLMLNIDNYKGSAVVRAALAFSALTFCRPGEIRHAEWPEVDFDVNEWKIPAEKMKGRIEHRVPLSRQALAILHDLYPLTGTGKYIFPNPRKKTSPLSENGILSALRNMGYDNTQMTAHGFRAMASTLLNELGCRSDVIEAQLAHQGADKIRAIYNRAQYMLERRQLMQQWADYLDTLRISAVKGN
jgi:integrase